MLFNTSRSSLVIDGFLHDFQTVAKSPVLYFYNTPGQDPEEILRNFVRQLILAQSNPFESFDERFRGGSKLSASDCWSRIKSFIRTQDSLAIIIDALDNGSPDLRESSNQRHMMPSSHTFLALFRDLIEVIKGSPRPVKVFVSSQSTSEGLRAAFRDLKRDFTIQSFEISTDDQPMDDVIRVVKHEVESWAPGELLPNLVDPGATIRSKVKTSIIEAISRKSQRMFTWAILVLRRRFRDNKELRTVEDVDNELKADQVPQRLEELYDAIFDTFHGSQSSPSSQKSGRVIKILFCAKKGLSSSAFIEAAAAATQSSFLGESHEQSVHNLISSCLGWVIYDAERDMFRFQHPSVEQYLHKKSEHSDFGSQAHATMAEACLETVTRSISRRNSFAERFGHGSDTDEEERGRSPSRDASSVGSSSQSRRRSNSNGSTSSRASQRSESESRPRRRTRSTESSDTESDENELKTRDLLRVSATDSLTNDPIQDFEEYATLYWVSHYQAFTGTAAENSQLREYVENILIYGGRYMQFSTISHPTGYFHRWIESIQNFFSRRPLGFYGQQVETELEHCLYPPPSPFRVGCVYGLTLIMKANADSDSSDGDCNESVRLSKRILAALKLSRRAIEHMKNEKNMTGLHLASKFGHVGTVQYLGSMDSAKGEIMVVDKHGKTPLQYAVETATDTVLVKEILKIPGAGALRTTSGVLIAAMRNTSCAQDLVRLLLGGRADVYRRVKTETRNLAVAAISYPFATLGLVKHVTSTLKVDRRLISAAASSRTGREVEWKRRRIIWEWLLEQWHKLGYSEAELDSVIDKSAANGDPELLKCLRKRAVGRLPGKDYQTFRLVLSQRRCLIELTDVMLHYIENRASTAALFLRAALEHRFVDVALVSKLAQHVHTETVLGRLQLKAIAKNRRHGAALLGNLPKTFSITSDVPTSQDALKVAVQEGNAEVIKMFLEHLKSLNMSLSEVEQLIRGVVASPLDGNYLQEYTAIAPADLFSMSEAPQSSWDGVIAECLGVFLSKLPLCDGLIQPLAEEIALLRGRKTMEVLLDHPATQSQNHPLRISRAMMLAAAKNKTFGFELLQFLPQRAAQGDMSQLGEVSVDDEILRTVARHGDVRSLTLLLGSYPLDYYSKEFMSAAAGNTDSAVAEYVFRRLDPTMVGMDELEKAAAASDPVFDCVLRHYDPGSQQGSVRLSAIIAERCRRSKSLIEAFRHGAAREPTSPKECQQLVLAAVRNMHGVEMASFLLKRFQMTDMRIRMTEEMLKFAARNRSAAPEMLRLLLGQCDDGWVESIVTADVLVEAASNGCEAPEALRILLLECKGTRKFAKGKDRDWIERSIGLNRDKAKEARRVFRAYLKEEKRQT